MKNLSTYEMETYIGGNFVSGVCEGIAAGSVVYEVGVVSEWWNPVGWVSGAMIVGDAACAAYGLSS